MMVCFNDLYDHNEDQDKMKLVNLFSQAEQFTQESPCS